MADGGGDHMKPVPIHPLSALAGAGLLTLVLLAAGAVQAPIRVQAFPDCAGLVRVAGIPDPRDMVVIKEGTPFVVPPGKLLAISGLGGTHDLGANTLEVTLRVDGRDEFAASVRLPYGSGTTMAEPPPGFTVHAGSTVEVVSANGSFGCAWGYVVDAGSHTPGLVRIAGVPDPRSMVVIREGTPFIVPPGKLLTITGLGGIASATGATVKVDGLNAFVAAANWSVGSSCSVCPVPPGLAIQAGSSVTVDSGTGVLGRAWGYLVDG